MIRRLLTVLTALAAASAGCDAPPAGRPATPMTTRFDVRPWDTGTGRGRELVSEHYRVFTTAESPEILNYLPGFLEAAHDNYLSLTGLPDRPAAEPMAVYMMGTRQEWASLTRSIVGPQWDTYAQIQAGGYCFRGVCVFWDIGGIASLSVASHEGLHQFVHHRFAERLPMWLEEGLAAQAEGYEVDGPSVRFTPGRNPARFNDLRHAMVNDWWIPLEKLLVMDGGDAVALGAPERAVGYYAQVWALGDLLRTAPDLADKRAELLADAEAGRFHERLDMPRAKLERVRRLGRAYNRLVSVPLFRRYITAELDTFDARLKKHARELAGLD